MTECLCMNHPDYSEFYCARFLIAKKYHRCCECKCAIKPGEKYEYVTDENSSGLFIAKTCMQCATIRNEMFRYGFIHEKLWSTIHAELCCWDGLSESDDEYFCVCPPENPYEAYAEKFWGKEGQKPPEIIRLPIIRWITTLRKLLGI